MSSEVYDAVVAGHLCLDIIPTLLGQDIQFLPGKLVEAGRVVTTTGGAVSNTGLSLSKLGLKTRLIGKIGDDLFGDAVQKSIAALGQGLAAGLVVSPGEPTSYSIILSPPGADRMFLHAPGCNATFTDNDINYTAVAAARLFHFGYPPLMQQTYANGGETLVSILRRAKETGATTSLDFSVPDAAGPAGRVNWAEILKRVLPFADICLPSIEELLIMLRPEEYSRLGGAGGGEALIDRVTPELLGSLGEQLLNLGVKIAVIKLGHRGVYCRTAGHAALSQLGRAAPADLTPWESREFWSPCFLAEVAGTTGAGDATIAGFLMGLLRGMPPEQAVTAACAVGGCNVEAADALSGVQTWDETSARIQFGWSRRPLNIPSPGWTLDEGTGVWVGPCNGVGTSE